MVALFCDQRVDAILERVSVLEERIDDALAAIAMKDIENAELRRAMQMAEEDKCRRMDAAILDAIEKSPNGINSSTLYRKVFCREPLVDKEASAMRLEQRGLIHVARKPGNGKIATIYRPGPAPKCLPLSKYGLSLLWCLHRKGRAGKDWVSLGRCSVFRSSKVIAGAEAKSRAIKELVDAGLIEAREAVVSNNRTTLLRITSRGVSATQFATLKDIA